MDNLVFDGRGDCLLGCHSSRGGGGGNWMSLTRPERLRRRLTAGVDKKKNKKQKQNQTKQTSKQPQQKGGKKDKEHMVEIK